MGTFISTAALRQIDMLRGMSANQSASPDDQPPRVLGALDATCVVVGAIIGVGIFFTPSGVASLCRSTTLSLLAWAIAGVIALCGALVFAELGGRYHGSGAQYQVLRDSYGPLVGFVFVFCNATAIIAGSMGIIALVCAQNLLAAIGNHDPTSLSIMALSCTLILGLTIANIIGVRWGSRIQNLTVYAKVFTLLAITVMAVFFVPQDAPAIAPATAQDGRFGVVAALLAALVPTLFAYGGWQQALWIAGEVRNPARNLPIAIIGGVILVVTVYLLVNWAYLHLLGPSGVAQSPALAADAVAIAAPNLGRRLVGGAVALSAFGVLNAQLLTGPRLIFGLARDGRFFALFARLNTSCGTPVFAILLLAIFSLTLVIAAGADRINALLNGVVFIDGIFFAMTGAAMMVLRIRQSRAALDLDVAIAPPRMRVPFAGLVLPVFLVGEIGVVIGAYVDPDVRKAAYIGAAWIAVAIVLYFAFFSAASRPSSP